MHTCVSAAEAVAGTERNGGCGSGSGWESAKFVAIIYATPIVQQGVCPRLTGFF